MADRELTPKQQAFVREYLIDLNATQAAIRAGYSPRSAGTEGERLLKNAEIARAVQQVMDKRAARTEIDADYVLRGIKETIERCKQAEPARDAEGNIVGDYKFEPAAVLKGYELLGKHLKLFTDKIEVSGEATVLVKDFTGRKDA